ncbi:heavy-metal-associated domain-containing protein [Modicisalibacter luteus]|uniref:heavy-metal-associated domain-containing protein n=1 Tax=Modicisalibacter luteus TaxID=453962 RepID=UPI003644A197
MATESASFDITHQWIVQGMDCPSCATRIRGAVERLAGVQDVQVSVTDETLSLRLDTDKTSPTRVERTVEALGYGIALQTDGRQGAAVSCCQSSCCGSQVANSEAESAPADDMLSWHVEGMDCPSCVTKVRGAVERLPGVADVRVSLMRETLSCTSTRLAFHVPMSNGRSPDSAIGCPGRAMRKVPAMISNRHLSSQG